MNSERTSYLVLRIAGSCCALPVSQVAEVLRPPPLIADMRQIPGLLGIARLRGEPVPVFSLAALLGIAESIDPAGPLDRPGRRIVRLLLAGQPVALLVDEIVGLQPLSPEELRTFSLPGGREQAVGRFDQAFAQLLELSGLLPELPAAEPA